MEIMDSSWQNEWFDDDEDFGDEDIDYEPNESDVDDNYQSSESDVDFFDEETRQNMIEEPKITLLSKDKTIQYSPEESGCKVEKVFTFGMTSGATVLASSRCVDPLSAFLLFIEPFEQTVVDMTNLYGLRNYGTTWENVDIQTMRAYYGLMLLAGVYRSHGERVTEMWNAKTGRPIFAATMSLEQYITITQCLRFDDREERKNARSHDKLAPIRTIIEKWTQRLKLAYSPGANVTVGEQLLPYRGRCPFIQHIPSKPCKYGIKHWVLCDAESHYVYDIEVYTGEYNLEINLGEQVVLQLTEGLNGRNVICDKIFTSHDLAKKLKQRQMTIVGEICKKRKELPPILLDMKSKPRYHSEFAFDHSLNATLVSYVTKKRRFKTFLSTMHYTRKITEDDGVQKTPEIIKFYNATQGAVDKMDEVLSTYRCKRQLIRWPVVIFCNMIDISALNAYVLFVQMNPLWNYTKKNFRRRLFLLELGHSLVSPQVEQRERILKSNPDLLKSNPDLNEIPPPQVPETSATSRYRLEHHIPSKKRARCHMCPQVRAANIHSVECDKCIKKVCPWHRFILCEKCEAE